MKSAVVRACAGDWHGFRGGLYLSVVSGRGFSCKIV